MEDFMEWMTWTVWTVCVLLPLLCVLAGLLWWTAHFDLADLRRKKREERRFGEEEDLVWFEKWSGRATIILAILGFLWWAPRFPPFVLDPKAGRFCLRQVVLATEDHLANELIFRHDRPVEAGEKAIVIRDLDYELMYVRFVADDYVGMFYREWFRPAIGMYLWEGLFCDDEFTEGQTVYVTPDMADELTRSRIRPTKPWEPVLVMEMQDYSQERIRFPDGYLEIHYWNPFLMVRFPDGYQDWFEDDWFYPHPPDWLDVTTQ